MTNPYQSSNTSTQLNAVAHNWYVAFNRLCWPVWWIGTALIAGSWVNIVSPTIGWVGFGIAGAAAIGSYVLTSFAGVASQDCVVLDSRLLKSKDNSYSDAMRRFSCGATLMFDGVSFGFRPNNEIACAVAASSPNVTEAEALEIAAHAQSVFDRLNESSPEFATAVAGRTFRISIMSRMDIGAVELVRIIDGRIESRVG